jgi:hypothetical protein
MKKFGLLALLLALAVMIGCPAETSTPPADTGDEAATEEGGEAGEEAAAEEGGEEAAAEEGGEEGEEAAAEEGGEEAAPEETELPALPE